MNVFDMDQVVSCGSYLDANSLLVTAIDADNVNDVFYALEQGADVSYSIFDAKSDAVLGLLVRYYMKNTTQSKYTTHFLSFLEACLDTTNPNFVQVLLCNSTNAYFLTDKERQFLLDYFKYDSRSIIKISLNFL